MRIAFLPGVFPMLSETPVLNQITGLTARGHEVDIFGDRPKSVAPYHPSIDQLALLQHAQYRPDLAPTTWARWKQSWQLYTEAKGDERRALRRSMNVLRFGTRAATGRLPLQTAQFLPVRRYDIIQAGFGEQGLKALRMLRVGAIHGKLVTAFRGADLTRFVRRRNPRVYGPLFRHGELFQPVCDAFAERLEAMGCPKERIRVHRTGIDLARFAFEPRPPGTIFQVISIGRLVAKKGLGDGLTAFHALVRTGVQARYTIVGDGPLRNRLEQQAAMQGIGAAVEFTGALSQLEVHARLARSHLLLAPSVTAPDGDQEGIPNVLKEAMALGVLVLSTRHSGIPELVLNERTGFVVPEHDVPALEAALQSIWKSSERWPDITAAARRKVEQEYDIERLNDQLVRVYENLLRS